MVPVRSVNRSQSNTPNSPMNWMQEARRDRPRVGGSRSGELLGRSLSDEPALEAGTRAFVFGRLAGAIARGDGWSHHRGCCR